MTVRLLPLGIFLSVFVVSLLGFSKSSMSNRVEVQGEVVDWDVTIDEGSHMYAEIVSYEGLDGRAGKTTATWHTNTRLNKGEKVPVVYEVDSDDAYVGRVPVLLWWVVGLIMLAFAWSSTVLRTQLCGDEENSDSSVPAGQLRAGIGSSLMLVSFIFVIPGLSGSCSGGFEVLVFPFGIMAVLAIVASALLPSLATWGIPAGLLAIVFEVAFPEARAETVWGAVAGVVAIAPLHHAGIILANRAKKLRSKEQLQKRERDILTIERFEQARSGNAPGMFAVERDLDDASKVRVYPSGETLPYEGPELTTAGEYLLEGIMSQKVAPGDNYRSQNTIDIIAAGSAIKKPLQPDPLPRIWPNYLRSLLAFVLASGVVAFAIYPTHRRICSTNENMCVTQNASDSPRAKR